MNYEEHIDACKHKFNAISFEVNFFCLAVVTLTFIGFQHAEGPQLYGHTRVHSNLTVHSTYLQWILFRNNFQFGHDKLFELLQSEPWE